MAWLAPLIVAHPLPPCSRSLARHLSRHRTEPIRGTKQPGLLPASIIRCPAIASKATHPRQRTRCRSQHNSPTASIGLQLATHRAPTKIATTQCPLLLSLPPSLLLLPTLTIVIQQYPALSCLTLPSVRACVRAPRIATARALLSYTYAHYCLIADVSRLDATRALSLSLSLSRARVSLSLSPPPPVPFRAALAVTASAPLSSSQPSSCMHPARHR